jgi:hypothetical protein
VPTIAEAGAQFNSRSGSVLGAGRHGKFVDKISKDTMRALATADVRDGSPNSA